MKYLLVLLMLVSCGKKEFITDLVSTGEDLIQDSTRTVGKAINDTFNEGDRTSNKLITDANDVKNEIASNTGNFTESIGDAGEALGQAPDKIFNSLVDQEKQDDNANNIQQLEDELNALRDELYSLTGKLFDRMDSAESSIDNIENDINDLENSLDDLDSKFSRKVANLKRKIRRVKQSNRAAIRRLRSQLRHKFSRLARATRHQVRRLNREIRGLQSDISDLEDEVSDLGNELDSLYVSCSYLGRSPIVTGCTLESDD